MKHIKISILKSLPLLTIIVTLFFSSCHSDDEISSGKDNSSDSCSAISSGIVMNAEQYKSAGIETGVIEKKTINAILKVNGKLDVPPQNLVSVSAPLNGFLKSTIMLEGLYVKKGEVIATIEHPDIAQLQQDFIEAKSKFELLGLELKRQQDLNKENVNAAKVLQQTESEYAIAQAKYKALEEKIRMAGINKNSVTEGKISGVISVIAPINGYVTKVNVNIGKMVNQHDIMFEIVDTEHLHAELTVFEKDVTRLKVGQKVRFTLANDPEKELTASIHLIGRAFDDSRSVRMHCHLDKEDNQLLPGMYINAIIELENQETNCVPVESVVKENEKEYIFLSDENKSCGKHEACEAHELCPKEEDCGEHPLCEAHEKCTDKKNCKHTACREHESCTTKSTVNGHVFKAIEVKTGVSDGKYIEIKPLHEINAGSVIVTKGAFFVLSQLKMSGSLEACCN